MAAPFTSTPRPASAYFVHSGSPISPEAFAACQALVAMVIAAIRIVISMLTSYLGAERLQIDKLTDRIDPGSEQFAGEPERFTQPLRTVGVAKALPVSQGFCHSEFAFRPLGIGVLPCDIFVIRHGAL